MPSISLVTLGCAKNEVDSFNMRKRIAEGGYELVDDAMRADAVIVNTCCFIQEATEESIDAILDIASASEEAEAQPRIIVAGCMPARYGEDLAAELDEASAFVPCSKEDDIVAVLDGMFDINRLVGSNIVARPLLGENAPSAYVKISDGCDRFCSYCAIPYIRGRYHSFSKETIYESVRERVGMGAREIVLIAQDTGRWGSDLDGAPTLAMLLDGLATDFPDIWFRVMYVQPEGVTDELIACVAAHENVCSYFDIPFQHCNPAMLKAMNRKGSSGEFLDLLERIRKAIPGVTLRTTLIAGFPGETDEQFEELCDFVDDADLDYIGVFAYSREEGTRAFDMDGQVDDDEKRRRAQVLRDLADSVCTPKVAARIGETMDVVVCGSEEDGQLFGRAQCQAPDVDGVTYIDRGSVGDIVRVRIEDAVLYEMEGTVVS